MSAPSIIQLPIELLERILFFAVPDPQHRLWQSVTYVPQGELRKYDGWKQTCFAIRTTCRIFSRVAAPKAALFHTFYWFPTNRSMSRLEKVVENCPSLVKNITFFKPAFGYETFTFDDFKYHGSTEEAAIEKSMQTMQVSTGVKGTTSLTGC